jgi:hypothetical protein
MTRLKGSISKELPKAPHTVRLSMEQKLEFLANLIVDRILEDQHDNQKLLKLIEATSGTEPVTA